MTFHNGPQNLMVTASFQLYLELKAMSSHVFRVGPSIPPVEKIRRCPPRCRGCVQPILI